MWMDRCELERADRSSNCGYTRYLKNGKSQITIMRRRERKREGSEYFEKYSHGIVVNAGPVKGQIRR
jgi:hypothetical protein